MARRRSKRPVVPEAGQALDMLKAQVMRQEGYQVNANQPEQVKCEVARTLGVPLQPGYNGHLRTDQAGKVGGEIGGAMVRELVRMAQERLAQTPRA
jgi:small acid-soluble spore protein D (minor alpha/beta-type SASP)